jgi:hypothetical protein
VLRIAREAEAKPTTKRPRGRPRKVIIVEKDSEEEAEDLESLLDNSDEEPAKRTRYATRSRGGVSFSFCISREFAYLGSKL